MLVAQSEGRLYQLRERTAARLFQFHKNVLTCVNDRGNQLLVMPFYFNAVKLRTIGSYTPGNVVWLLRSVSKTTSPGV